MKVSIYLFSIFNQIFRQNDVATHHNIWCDVTKNKAYFFWCTLVYIRTYHTFFPSYPFVPRPLKSQVFSYGEPIYCNCTIESSYGRRHFDLWGCMGEVILACTHINSSRHLVFEWIDYFLSVSVNHDDVTFCANFHFENAIRIF